MKKLLPDSRGIAHHFLLALIVVGVAIFGTYYLVASKADSCDVSSATSEVSGVTEPGPGCPVSQPVTEPGLPSLACEFQKVPVSATLEQLKSYPFDMTIYNVGTGVSKSADLQVFLSDGKNVNTTAYHDTIEALNPKTSITRHMTLNLSHIPTNFTGSLVLSVLLDGPCGQTHNITITSATAALTYKLSCTVADVPKTLKKGDKFKATVTVKNIGTGTLNNVWGGEKASIIVNKGTGFTVALPGTTANVSPGKSFSQQTANISIGKGSKATSATVSFKPYGFQFNSTHAMVTTSCQKSFTVK